MGHNMEKTLQWQFEDLFLNPGLPVMSHLRQTTFFASSFLFHFLSAYLVSIHTLFKSRNCPCCNSQTVASSKKTSAMQYFSTNH